jgi:hypothetical protein
MPEVTAGGADGTVRGACGSAGGAAFARVVEDRRAAARGCGCLRGLAAGFLVRRLAGVALPSLSSVLTACIVPHETPYRP